MIGEYIRQVSAKFQIANLYSNYFISVFVNPLCHENEPKSRQVTAAILKILRCTETFKLWLCDLFLHWINL